MVRKQDSESAFEPVDPVEPVEPVESDKPADDVTEDRPHIGDGVYQADGEIDKTIGDDTEIAYDDENGERQQISRSEYQEKGLG